MNCKSCFWSDFGVSPSERKFKALFIQFIFSFCSFRSDVKQGKIPRGKGGDIFVPTVATVICHGFASTMNWVVVEEYVLKCSQRSSLYSYSLISLIDLDWKDWMCLIARKQRGKVHVLSLKYCCNNKYGILWAPLFHASRKAFWEM